MLAWNALLQKTHGAARRYDRMSKGTLLALAQSDILHKHGGDIMLYPILSLSDDYSTEITASKPNDNNEIKVYVEWVDNDDFENITYLISSNNRTIVIEQNTNSNSEVRLKYYYDLIEKMKNDIIEYIDDKQKEVKYA